MQKLIFFILAQSFSLMVSAQTAGDRILGQWTNESKTRIIEFVKNGSVYEAIIRKAEDKSLIGKKQITGLKSAGNGKYKDGVIHVYQRNTTASCTVKLPGETKLEITGKVGLMSKSQTWTKVK